MKPQPITSPPTQLLRLPAVCDRIQLSGTTIWRLQRAGAFPRPIRISTQAIAWLESDIEQWIQARAQHTTTERDDDAVVTGPTPARPARRGRARRVS